MILQHTTTTTPKYRLSSSILVLKRLYFTMFCLIRLAASVSPCILCHVPRECWSLRLDFLKSQHWKLHCGRLNITNWSVEMRLILSHTLHHPAILVYVVHSTHPRNYEGIIIPFWGDRTWSSGRKSPWQIWPCFSLIIRLDFYWPIQIQPICFRWTSAASFDMNSWWYQDLVP